jgi:tricarballylate dehydrogenase
MTDIKESDVVVVGCGIAGLSAAVAAAQQGARVAVLERAPREERGGNTRHTESFLRMKNLDEVADDFESHFAAHAGGHLDPELIRHTLRPPERQPSIVRALSFADPNLIATFAGAAGPTLRWLTTFGVRIEFLPTPFLTMSTPRMAPIGGGLAFVEALTAAAERLDVSFSYETTARALIQSDRGTVDGVRAVTRANRRVDFVAHGVVLASGGFEGNPEMLSRYIGPKALYLRPVARGGYYNRGEGIVMALEIGAAGCGDFSSYHAEPVDPRSGRAEAAVFVYPYGILVNGEGRRFVDEARGTVDATYEAVTRRIFDQSQGLAYCILDAKLGDVPNAERAIRTDQPPVTAPSVAALAEKLGIPVGELEQTVAAYNGGCVPGAFKPLQLDGLATRGVDPPKSNWARSLDTPPFQAYPMISSNVLTFGGLKVNSDAQVLNADGEVIPGLYAAGETVGIYYGSYAGSTSVLKGAVFGRLAGIAAAGRSAGLARA